MRGEAINSDREHIRGFVFTNQHAKERSSSIFAFGSEFASDRFSYQRHWKSWVIFSKSCVEEQHPCRGVWDLNGQGPKTEVLSRITQCRNLKSCCFFSLQASVGQQLAQRKAEKQSKHRWAKRKDGVKFLALSSRQNPRVSRASRKTEKSLVQSCFFSLYDFCSLKGCTAEASKG